MGGRSVHVLEGLEAAVWEKISGCFERRGLLFGEINPCFKGIRGCYLEGSIRVLKGFWGLLFEEISPCFRGIKGCCLGKHQSVF